MAADGPEAVAAIEGVGDAISEKVIEYLETGTIDELEELRAELPVEMDELTAVEGVGPKSVGALFEGLGITNLDELEAAAEAGEISAVKGFGAKTEENILENIPFAREAQERELLGHARPVADDVLAHMRGADVVEEAAVAGSIRRWKPTIGDVDILVATDSATEVVERFRSWDHVDSVIEAGEQRASVRARGIQIDLRVVVPSEFGSAIQYFTGSRDHNVRLRNRAIDRDMKMNEYGVFDVSEVDEATRESDRRAGTRIAGETEASMYDAINLPWIPPEIREDTGEVAAAAAAELPCLIDHDDIRGDVHVHTSWSDGSLDLEALVAAAERFGHDYVAICDHAAGPGIIGGTGLSDAELETQAAEVRALDEQFDIGVLAGVETNVHADGTISVADDLLETLDIVVASPHSELDQGVEEATDRLVRAVSHPAVDVLGHPTGRLINSRAGLEIRIEPIASAAAEHGTALEVNANPHRLDLSGAMVRAAIEANATIAINTDAHSAAEFDHMRYGVHTARRGWAEPVDVINAWDREELESFLAACVSS